MQNSMLVMKGISKSFGIVQALSEADFDLRSGEIHALVGENGAGKSTLMKCLSGVHIPDSGEIILNGTPVQIKTPLEAIQQSISLIHQELAVVEQLTVASNIFMGDEPITARHTIDTKRMNDECNSILNQLGAQFRATTRVYELTTADKQIVEIAKALRRQSKILIMDEPTASLSQRETEKIFEIINDLKEKGLGIIYISHRMEEIFELCDRITVMRDGRTIQTLKTTDTSQSDLINMMVGYDLKNYYGKTPGNVGDIILEVNGLSRTDNAVQNISFYARQGEIVGFAGLVGAGRSELMQAIFGVAPISSGEIKINGKAISITSPRVAIANGICMVPEDRKLQGLIISNTVGFNITICALRQFMKGIWVNRRKERDIILNGIEKMNIKVASPTQLAGNLSGGNQQKVVLAKMMAISSDVLIFDEPTRGIDVGAKKEIYGILESLAKSGKCILMVSSELPEVINMSDRIYVMRDGEIRGCLENEEVTDQEKLLAYAWGI